MSRINDIYPLAEEQLGYFTTAQAVAAGLSKYQLNRMARGGEIDRVSWGLYRLRNFPRSVLDQYMEASLWPLGTKGVLSHETALELFDLSDAAPEKIHVTIPVAHRVRRTVPLQYRLHRSSLQPDEITSHEGIPITTVARTIRDCHTASVGPAIVRQAIEEACKRGQISRREANTLERELLPSPAPTPQ
jgi:predicted transcriptional regulator of viral defense system